MSDKFSHYQSANHPLPEQSFAWNLYGAGLEHLGKNGQPEPFSVPEPTDDQLLVRIDAVSICFSDVKILKQGGSHPKLYNRNLSVDPTRLGHEVSLTIIKVGKNLAGRYVAGQRLAVQPDIYQQGLSTAYGYTIPGGLVQYHCIGKEVLETDTGACLLPMEPGMGYAESALLEPWGCVAAAYTQRRRHLPGRQPFCVRQKRFGQRGHAQTIGRSRHPVVRGGNGGADFWRTVDQKRTGGPARRGRRPV